MSTSLQGKTVLVMAGGTGGHVFPALATAEVLQQHGLNIEWLGTARGIESDLVPKAGIRLTCIPVAGLRGKGPVSLLLAPFKLVIALWQALVAVRKINPVCVLGMGGFASGPGGVAAWVLRKPLVIHEQNAVAGMTNKYLSRVATRVLTAFPGALGKKGEQVGNPLRGAIIDLSAPEQRLQNRTGKIRLLVLGGSLGAQALNETVPAALATMAESDRPEVWHQAGKRNFAGAEDAYKKQQIDGKVTAFIDDMAAAYE